MNNQKSIAELRDNKEITELFERLGFKDEHGHYLTSCVDFHNLIKVNEIMQKARAVLAEYSEAVEMARRDIEKIGSIEGSSYSALVALADAIGGRE